MAGRISGAEPVTHRVHWTAYAGIVAFIAGGLYVAIGDAARAQKSIDDNRLAIAQNAQEIRDLKAAAGKRDTAIGRIETKLDAQGKQIDRVEGGIEEIKRYLINRGMDGRVK